MVQGTDGKYYAMSQGDFDKIKSADTGHVNHGGNIKFVLKPTKSSIQTQLDKMPGGENYFVRKNSDGSFSVVRKDTNKATPIKVAEDGSLYTPNAVDVPKDLQLHHYATNKNKLVTPELQKITDKYGLDIDGDWNKEYLPHLGSHPNEYHKFVKDGMERADREARGNKDKFLELFETYVKKPIRDNPKLLDKDGWS